MADKQHDVNKANEEAARKKIAEQKSAREAQAKEAPVEGKPTPTQEENDLAAMGVHVIDKEPDGSPEQPQGMQTKQEQARKPAAAGQTYPTRSMSPAKPE